jgi:hypothetical protein
MGVLMTIEQIAIGLLLLSLGMTVIMGLLNLRSTSLERERAAERAAHMAELRSHAEGQGQR